MKSLLLCLLLLMATVFPLFPRVEAATSVAASVSGKILLDVQSHGEAWYVYPKTLERFYLKDGEAAYGIMRSFGLGITNADLARIPSVANVNEMKNAQSSCGNTLANSVKGKILLQVQAHGEAWYVEPSKCARIYMKDGAEAYTIMRYLGLGITSADLSTIVIGAGSALPPLDAESQYIARTIVTSEGTFPIRLAMLKRSEFSMVTDTGVSADCTHDCTAKPLKDYVIENGAYAGMHGAYACPPDYADCASKINSFDAPVFNTELDTMINDDSIKFFDRPMMVETSDGQLTYFHRGSDFGTSLADYQKRSKKTVTAAIGNWPSLVEDGKSVIAGEPTETAFNTKAVRGGLGYDDDYYYLVIASNATVPNLAAIFMALHADYALNLDGGATAAMYYNGAYTFGPGRQLSNAVVFKKR
jgi:hypothetical protein